MEEHLLRTWSPATPAILDNCLTISTLPSIFAIRAIRRRVVESGIDTRGTDELEQVLTLDPLTILRCMRIAGCPLAGPESARTIPALFDHLGRSFVLRALRVAEVPTFDDREVHALWLHSLATAHAARNLAAKGDLISGDEAYLRGLLLHAARWCKLLGSAWGSDPLTRLEQWNLPDDFLSPENRDVAKLLDEAELLATLAEFPPPGRGEEIACDDDDISAISKETLVEARDLRREVHATLAELGLDSSFPSDTSSSAAPPSRLFWHEQRGSNTDFIAGLLLCRQSSSYRSIVTVATAAALRYLDFDRATFVSWSRETKSVFIKAKADFSIRRLAPTRCPLSDDEQEMFREALASERPQLLTRMGDDGGLLEHLGADDAMLVVASREFETPTFLVFDRTLSRRALDLHLDATPATVLGSTVAILIDNLRLRLQRIRAQQMAVTDPLTRLNNRAVGLVSLEREMVRAQREHLPLAVLMLDLDEFKDLNDTHGHLVGDQALRVTANVLRRTVRRSDVVCRYGGEEFLVVLPATSAEEASVLAARLFTEVERSGQEYRLPLTVSIGLSSLRDTDETTDDLVQRADQALYASKSRGRNRFSVNTP